MKNCPECNSTKLQPINKEGTHLYCTDCNSAFKEGAQKVEQGSLGFNGVVTAQKVFEILTGGRDDMTPEMRSALETQMTGIIFEQWFEGFKAGQLANILYVKEYYNDNGKTRSKSTSTTGQHEGRTETTGGKSSDSENSSGRESNSQPQSGNQRIRELVGGVQLEYPQHIKVPENVYAEVAELVDSLSVKPERVKYDGRTLQPVIKTGI